MISSESPRLPRRLPTAPAISSWDGPSLMQQILPPPPRQLLVRWSRQKSAGDAVLPMALQSLLRGVHMRRLAFFFLATALAAIAQNNPEQNAAAQNATAQSADSQPQAAAPTSLKQVTVPAGTEVPLILK